MPDPSHNGDERSAVRSTPFNVVSYFSSGSCGIARGDLTHEMLGEGSRNSILGKEQKLKNKLEKEREHHLSILESYLNETLRNIEETCYRMHLYWFQKKIKQYEILVAHICPIHSLTSLSSFNRTCKIYG